jgi:hypothetical protein
MVLANAGHSAAVAQWLLDWDAARDAVIADKLKAVHRRKRSYLHSAMVVSLAHAIEGAALTMNSAESVPDTITGFFSASRLLQWAKARTQEDAGVLIVHEEDIDERVGRACPTPPTRPAGMYLYGSVGTGNGARFSTEIYT